jgi:hypothetical protein
MQPDTPTPGVAEPIPTVATSPEGVRVGVDIGPPLQAAINKAIDDVVAKHPAVGAVRTVMRDKVFTDRALLQGASIDLVAASVATVSTFLSPDGRFTAAAWVITGALAAKTLLSALGCMIIQWNSTA